MKATLSVVSASIEVLESRIAPANIFFDPTQGALSDAKGKSLAGDAAAAARAGADNAVLLKAGDTLVIDSTPTFSTAKVKGKKVTQQVPDSNSIQLASVTGGSALLFLTDLDDNGGYENGELTGLVVSDKFKGSVNGDVNGSVGTLFSLQGSSKGKAITFTGGILSNASILELSVSGRITGSLLAGGAISNVSIGGNGEGLSVQSIVTGSAAAGAAFSFNGGGKSFTVENANLAKGSAGGSIQGAVLARGASLIGAGVGGVGGDGGNVSAVTIASQPGSLSILAGDGTDADRGHGGNAGSVSDVRISSLSGDLRIVAGIGGYGGESQKGHDGGAGGSVARVTVDSLASGSISIAAGDGGYGGYSYKGRSYFGGSGGSGGEVSQITISIASDVESLEVAAGAGGDGQVIKNGGAGGFVSGVKVTGAGAFGSASISAGAGGVSGDEGGGGNGGDIANVELQARSVSVEAGEGGVSGGPLPGGNGGSVSNLVLSRVSGSVDVIGGDAGYAGYSYVDKRSVTLYTGAVGGVGGSVRHVTINGSGSGTSSSGFTIAAGAGGDGTVNQNGGAGGVVTHVAVNLTDILIGLSISGGAGGIAPADYTTGAIGGAGGMITNVSVTAGAILGLAEIIGGAGGDGDIGGGAGGSLSLINLVAQAGGWGAFGPVFLAGTGGAGPQTGAAGAVAASVTSNYAPPQEE